MAISEPPKIILPVWQQMFIGGKAIAIKRTYPDGLAVVVSIETYYDGDIDIPHAGIGSYSHISLSRKNKYPHWDEMRDFIYSSSCPWFDHDRDVVMILPKKSDYVNVHPNCFHFYQKEI